MLRIHLSLPPNAIYVNMEQNKESSDEKCEHTRIRRRKCEVEYMKKKISKVLILSLCVLLLAGCQKNAETDKDTEEDKKTESLEVEDTEKEDKTKRIR